MGGTQALDPFGPSELRVKRMVVDQIDTDGERMLRLCRVPPTRCNRLLLGHLTHGEPKIALLEFGESGSPD